MIDAGEHKEVEIPIENSPDVPEVPVSLPEKSTRIC